MTDTTTVDEQQTDENVIELRPHNSFSKDVRKRSKAKKESYDREAAHRSITALLFVSPTPLSAVDLGEALKLKEETVEDLLAEMMGEFTDEKSGIVLERVAGGWAFRASELANPALERLFKPSADTKLSPASMETLAIIAYTQPVSRPDVARIRGVAADAAVNGLLERGLVEEAGRADNGAILFRTTPTFERAFGLPSLAALPALDGFAPGENTVKDLREKLDQMSAARVD